MNHDAKNLKHWLGWHDEKHFHLLPNALATAFCLKKLDAQKKVPETHIGLTFLRRYSFSFCLARFK